MSEGVSNVKEGREGERGVLNASSKADESRDEGIGSLCRALPLSTFGVGVSTSPNLSEKGFLVGVYLEEEDMVRQGILWGLARRSSM
jgi:hypothetical protein